MKIKKQSPSEIVFDAANLFIMLVILFITLFPFWYAAVGSLSNGADYMRGGVYFFPRKFTLDNFRVILSKTDILLAFRVTILRTLIGTAGHILVTSLFAYAISRKNLLGRKVYNAIGLFTMFFSGGLIPYYILIKNIGLYDNFLVYILPGLFSFFNVIIFLSFFREIPESVIESAKIDGAKDYRIFFNLIFPMSKPVIAALTLFTAVNHWNSFYDCMMFTSKSDLQTIQLYLMKVIRVNEMASTMSDIAAASSQFNKISPVTIQLATMMVATIPIIIVYPFLQKYFVKGMMIGSIKG